MNKTTMLLIELLKQEAKHDNFVAETLKHPSSGEEPDNYEIAFKDGCVFALEHAIHLIEKYLCEDEG